MSTAEDFQVFLIKREIEKLSVEKQAVIAAIVEAIRSNVERDPLGIMALALVGADSACEGAAMTEEQTTMRTIGVFILAQGMLANSITGCHKLDVPKLVKLVDEILEALSHEP
jgi:hypothetical protein